MAAKEVKDVIDALSPEQREVCFKFWMRMALNLDEMGDEIQRRNERAGAGFQWLPADDAFEAAQRAIGAAAAAALKASQSFLQPKKKKAKAARAGK